MEQEMRKRIFRAWEDIVNQDNLSDEEAINIVAKRAGVKYGDAYQVLAVDPQHWPRT